MEVETEKLGWKTVGLDHPQVKAKLEETLASWRGGTVMIHSDDRWGRSHLKLHRDRAGSYYVRIGRRGSVKQEIDRCEITYCNGEPMLFQFRFKKSAAQLEWERKDRARLGIVD